MYIYILLLLIFKIINILIFVIIFVLGRFFSTGTGSAAWRLVRNCNIYI